MAYYNHKKILTIMRTTNTGGEILPDVEIKRIWLSYDPNSRFIGANYLVGKYYTYEDNEEIEHQCVNDASKIFINFKTSSITKAIENEIAAGHFVIRFDYPVRFKNNGFRNLLDRESSAEWHNTEMAKRVKGGKPSGHGARSFTYNLFERKESDAAFLVNSLIWITPEDIKTDKYGEKYIFKKLSFVELMNKFWDSSEGLNSLTILDEESKDYLIGNWDKVTVGGIPQLFLSHEDETQQELSANNAYRGATYVPAGLSYTGNNQHLYQIPSGNSVDSMAKIDSMPKYKFDAMYNMYAPLQIKTSNSTFIFSDLPIDSMFLLQKNCHVKVSSSIQTGSGNSFYAMRSAENQSKLHLKFFRTAVRPRCCIIDENYATKAKEEGSIWLKKFPLAKQGIYSTYKTIIEVPVEEGEDKIYIPIMRLKIDSIKN